MIPGAAAGSTSFNVRTRPAPRARTAKGAANGYSTSKGGAAIAAAIIVSRTATTSSARRVAKPLATPSSIRAGVARPGRNWTASVATAGSLPHGVVVGLSGESPRWARWEAIELSGVSPIVAAAVSPHAVAVTSTDRSFSTGQFRRRNYSRRRRVRMRRLVAATVLSGALLVGGSRLWAERGAFTSTFHPATVHATQPTADSPPPRVDAWAFVVLDGRTGSVLASRRADREVPVGSITKLMTAELVLAAGKSSRSVTVGDYQPADNETVVGLIPGETQPRDVLLRAMLIVSAGDAADALAVDVGGSREAFVAAMNQHAARVGMSHTHYANPTGLDEPGQYSSASDTARLAFRLMQNNVFRDAVARTSATLHGSPIEATNAFLGSFTGADGVKTGHTDQAGWCIAASASQGGRRLYAVVLGAPSREARDRAAAALLDWAFAAT